MTEDLYYFKVDRKNDIKSIYRLIVDDVNEKITELIWLDGRWQLTDNLVRMITAGEFFLEPVSRETVQRFTPYVDTGYYQPS